MKIIIAFCMTALFSSLACAASVEDDVTHYVQVFAGTDKKQHAEAVQSLQWKGISDVRVYDPIERLILEGAQQANNGDEVDRFSDYIRALGYSGQAKYTATITKMIADGHYKNNAKIALEDVPLYAKWDPIISNRATFDPKYSDDVNRVLNMLHSDDFMLKKIGAKRVYFGSKDEVLLEALVIQIRASYKINDSEYIDSIAWMLKGLGSAKQAKYRPLFEEVATNAMSYKTVGYAKRQLELLR